MPFLPNSDDYQVDQKEMLGLCFLMTLDLTKDTHCHV